MPAEDKLDMTCYIYVIKNTMNVEIKNVIKIGPTVYKINLEKTRDKE